MERMQAINMLTELDRRGVYVLTKGDLVKAFPDEQVKTLEKSLQRLVAEGILQRASKGIYVNPAAKSKTGNVIEDIAAVLRRGHFTYLTRESMLSEYGIISQVPLSRITLMTTGANGVYDTPYGTIEFTHTKRRPAEIIKRTLVAKDRPLRLATREAAVQDLVRCGRNVNMMDVREIAAWTSRTSTS
jgi:predicted transcriptional regulator of viral defense system